MTTFRFRFTGVGIGKFLKGWCCRKNEDSGTMGTLSRLGSKQREGSQWWEWSCSINGLNLTVFSPFLAAAGSCYRLITSDKPRCTLPAQHQAAERRSWWRKWSIWLPRSQRVPSGVSGDQNRAKRRVNIRPTVGRWTLTRLQTNDNTDLCQPNQLYEVIIYHCVSSFVCCPPPPLHPHKWPKKTTHAGLRLHDKKLKCPNELCSKCI